MDAESEDSSAANAPSIALQRRNIWFALGDAGFYGLGVSMMTPMFPFLFKQAGIDASWLGFIAVSGFIVALTGPIGTAWAAHLPRKLPFIIRLGILQRAPYSLIPLAIYFFFDKPTLLLGIVVAAWMLAASISGLSAPVFMVLLTDSFSEGWWGRMMGARSFVFSVSGLLAAGIVWAINRHVAVPLNYVLLGVAGLLFLFLSLASFGFFREIPVAPRASAAPARPRRISLHASEILVADRRVRWVVLTAALRSFGLLMGTYWVAFLIERCHLTATQMWIPMLMVAIPEPFAHVLSGWAVDRLGVKRVLMLSAFLVFVNSLILIHCTTLMAFVLLFPSGVVGGALINAAWPMLMLKLGPPARRVDYYSTLSVVTAPFSILTTMIGFLVLRHWGYDHVFYLSSAGGLVALFLYVFTLPDIGRTERGVARDVFGMQESPIGTIK